MKIYSYVITNDAGFAPNPFGGFLTLATCKPKIRAKISPGDLLFGTGSAAIVGNDKLVYAAIVHKVETLQNYGESEQYKIKIPSTRGEWWRKHGDNIYFIVDDEWQWRRNIHHPITELAKDTSGENALICNVFWYFGRDAVSIPENLRAVVKRGPGSKITTDEKMVASIVEWLRGLPNGVNGTPEMESDGHDVNPTKCGGAPC